MRRCKVNGWPAFGVFLLLALSIPLWTRCICPLLLPRKLQLEYSELLVLGMSELRLDTISRPHGETVLLRMNEADEKILDCQTSGEVSSLGLPH
jgi:hypothetical protein